MMTKEVFMGKNTTSSRNRQPVAVRLSKYEHELAQSLAKSHGSISQVLRDGLIDYFNKVNSFLNYCKVFQA